MYFLCLVSVNVPREHMKIVGVSASFHSPCQQTMTMRSRGGHFGGRGGVPSLCRWHVFPKLAWHFEGMDPSAILIGQSTHASTLSSITLCSSTKETPPLPP